MSFKNYLLLAFALVFVTQPAWAIEELLKNYRGIRSLGMGGVVTTTGIYDEALFANPAMHVEAPKWKLTILGLTAEANSHLIGDIKKVNEVKSASGTAVPQKIADTGLTSHNEHSRLTLLVPAFYSPTLFGENTGFGFGILVNSQTNIMLRANADVDALATLDAGPNFGIAHRFLNGDLNVGVNFHVLYRISSDQTLNAINFLAGQKLSLSSIGGQGIGFDGDLGAFYKIPIEPPFFKKLYVGASLNNFLQSTYRITGREIVKSIKASPIPNDRTGSIGVRADLPEMFIFNDTIASIEFQNIGTTRRLASFWKKLHMGAETKIFSRFSLRTGLNQGYIAGGIGIDLPIVKIDLASYGEEIGPTTGSLEDRRYAIRLSFDI